MHLWGFDLGWSLYYIRGEFYFEKPECDWWSMSLLSTSAPSPILHFLTLLMHPFQLYLCQGSGEIFKKGLQSLSFSLLASHSKIVQTTIPFLQFSRLLSSKVILFYLASFLCWNMYCSLWIKTALCSLIELDQHRAPFQHDWFTSHFLFKDCFLIQFYVIQQSVSHSKSIKFWKLFLKQVF